MTRERWKQSQALSPGRGQAAHRQQSNEPGNPIWVDWNIWLLMPLTIHGTNDLMPCLILIFSFEAQGTFFCHRLRISLWTPELEKNVWLKKFTLNRCANVQLSSSYVGNIFGKHPHKLCSLLQELNNWQSNIKEPKELFSGQELFHYFTIEYLLGGLYSIFALKVLCIKIPSESRKRNWTG